MNERDIRVIKWFCSGNVGISSQTLCACLYGFPPSPYINHPHDPGDFSRCKGFLDVLSPEEKGTALQAAAKLSPKWKALVERWADLEWMYDHRSSLEMFAEMQKILKESQ